MYNHPIVRNYKNKIDIIRYTDSIRKFQINYGWSANNIGIFDNKGLIMLDTGYRKTAHELAKTLKSESKIPVKYIINSHHHSDHIGGNTLYEKNCKIILNKPASKYLYFNKNIEYIETKTELNWNRDKIEIIPLPNGHSCSDMVIYLPLSNIIYTGDLYLSESFPLIGNKKYNKVQNLIKNLYYIFYLINDSTIIISGHGIDTNKKDLGNYIRMVKDTVNEVKKLMGKKISLPDIKGSNILQQWNEFGYKIEFINTDTWISDIYYSYIFEYL